MFYYWNLRMDETTAKALKSFPMRPIKERAVLAAVRAGTTETVELSLIARPSAYFGNTELYTTTQFNDSSLIDHVIDIPSTPAVTLLHRTTPLGTNLFGAIELSAKNTGPALEWTNTNPGEYLVSIHGAKIRVRQYMTDSKTDWDVQFDNPAAQDKYTNTIYFEADTPDAAKKAALRKIEARLEEMGKRVNELRQAITQKLIRIQDEELQANEADDIVCRAITAMRKYERRHQAIMSDTNGVIQTPKPFEILSAQAGQSTVKMELYFPKDNTTDTISERTATILYIETNRITIPE